MPTDIRSSLLALAILVRAALPVAAQANQNPLVDVRVVEASKIQVVGRVGTFPNGSNAISFESTVCNAGSVPIPWMGPMNEAHPTFAFLVARLADGRFEQISDRSFLKHGVLAGNSSQCGVCTLPPGPMGSALGVGCADVYSVTTNANQFILGPADEVDPWLGTWEHVCSHFDRGEPPVPPPADCDGERSLTQTQVSLFSPIQHRVVVSDAELAEPEALFFLQCQFTTQGEPEAARGDSFGSRRFTASFGGGSWTLAEVGSFQVGSVLERWSGATVASATNGGDDGRVYVAVEVSGPTQGMYRYEFALHNRDNARGVRTFRLPVCPGARVRNFDFHDVDDDPSNDWTVNVGANEIVFATATNPLRWNSIYNVGFDSDAAPVAASATLVAFDPGTGSPSFPVRTVTPGGLHNAFLGAGCSRATPPSLYAEGDPPRATLGNASFALASAGNPPGAESVLCRSLEHGSIVLDGCALWVGRGPRAVSTARADANGLARHPLPIPSDPGLEGLEIDFQCAVLLPVTGALHGRLDLSDALRVRVGSALPDCP